MTNSLPELIIKVGSKSSLSFSHSKAYRVVTYDELVATSKLLTDCHLVIIESINNEEYEAVRDFVKSFVDKDDTNKVWIYSGTNSDEVIDGLVDELGFDIFKDQDELFKDIFNKTSLNISTNAKLRRALNELSSPKDADDPFSAFTFTSIDDVKTEPETPDISNKAIAEDTEAVEEGIGASAEETGAVEEGIGALSEDTEAVREDIEAHSKDTEAVSDDTEALSEAVETLESDETTESTVSDDTNKIEDNINLNDTTTVDEDIKAVDSKELEELNLRLSIIKGEKDALEFKLDAKDKQISELTQLSKSLREKYQSVVDEYNAIVNSDETLEDPISLAEYSGLKNKLFNLEALLKEQKEKGKRQVAKFEYDIEDYKAQINELNEQLQKSRDDLKSRQDELLVLNEQITNGEIQSEELEASKLQVEDLKSSIEDLELVIKGQTKDINNLRDKIDEAVDRSDKENFGRQSSTQFSNLLVKKISELSNELKNLSIENNQHMEYIERLRSSDSDNNSIINSQASEIIQLRQQLNDVNKQIDEAVENERYEKSLLSKQLEELRTEFDFQREQLELKESQYNKLKAVTTLDENGANVLEEDNRTLREINNALRIQLKTSQDETERAREEKIREQQAKHLLEDQLVNMKASLKSMQVGMNGGVTQSANLPAINYNGRGTIISVFGCGSYGTTITAISLAKRLAMTSKVLYIDLDLLAPKSDAFFNLPPILRNMPGFSDKNSRTYTGMGLFFEQGINPLVHYREQSIIHVEPLRRGCLDYLGGVYYKLDPVKLMSADFTALLNYCGNMYSNVIIDLGRIGASDLSDKVIKVITDASMKSIGVTSSDIVDIRLLRMKMMDAKINLNKVAVLVNMSDSSKLDNKAVKFISPSLYGIMPFYSDLYGNRRETFIERRSRDKFDAFISNVVFRN